MTKKAVWGTAAGGAAAAVLAMVVAFAVPAAAENGGQAVAAVQTAAVTGADAATPDKTALCDRLKKHEQRRQALLTRLGADAGTRGSVAWLTAKAESATNSGDQALAKLYTDRAALRSQLLDPLKTVTSDLGAVIAAKCG